MATKRMFSKDVVRTDRFLDMPLSAQALYFHLGLDADIKGFVSPGLVMRITNAQPDDLNVLIAKEFVRPFKSGVIVVTHWHVNNKVRDTHEAPSQYIEEAEMLQLTPQGTYTLQENYSSTTVELPRSIGEVSGVKTLLPPAIAEKVLHKKGSDREGDEAKFLKFLQTQPKVRQPKAYLKTLVTKYGWPTVKKLEQIEFDRWNEYLDYWQKEAQTQA